LKLSVLDQSPIAYGSNAKEALRQTTELAKVTEALGYHRFWVSEHHDASTLAGSSPEVLIAHLAAHTKKIRLGSGGVMLPHYSAYKVAENFKLLEALHPGRIDVGLGRAPGGMPIAKMALQEGKEQNIHKYPLQVKDVIGYLQDDLPTDHRFHGLKATPLIDTVPDVWLLGSSGGSANVAAENGTGFAFAHFINGEGGVQAVESYRETFQPSALFDRPQTSVAIFVICADTDEQADQIASSLDLSLIMLENGQLSKGTPSIESALSYPYSPFERARIRENRKRMIVGSPKAVRQQLVELARAYETEEVIVVTITHRFEDRIRSYELLGEEWNVNVH
jgi:luciferase family oxidoreductase group 1